MKLRKTDTSDHYTSPPQQQTPPRLANIKEAWTKNEDTDSEYLKRYKRIQARVWQSHFDKACGVLMRADKGMQKSSSTEDKEKKTPLQSESDMFGENSLCSGYLKLREMTESQHRPKDVFCSTASRRYFLPKEDAFTGSEAVALRKLLKTLRIKKWGPQVYFHIRFFSVRHKLLAMTAEKKVLAEQRWHLLQRILSRMAVIQHVLAERSYEKSLSCVTCLDMVVESVHTNFYGPDKLPYDKDAFRVLTTMTLSNSALCTLRDTKPEDRQPEDIEQVVLSLQYVTAFAKLATTTQYRLAAEASYMSIGSNRVILRQGHVPQNYYFILLGQAEAKRFLRGGRTETTVILRKGDGFGGAAMISRSRRLVTVISRTPMRLMVVPRKLFHSVFISNIGPPCSQAINFISQMWFMKSWPTEHLVRCPHQCRIKQFRRTEIVEADAAASSWIYVVRKGVCRVYQKPVSQRRCLSARSTGKTGGQYRASCSLQTSMMDDNYTSFSLGSPVVQIDNFCKDLAECRRPVDVCLSQTTPRGGAHSKVLSSGATLSDRSTNDDQCSKILTSGRSPRPVSADMSHHHDYKLVQNLRRLDVFGLEDLNLNTTHPPPQRHLLLISDDAECVMLSKGFYLGLASPRLKKEVWAKLTGQKRRQVTLADCSLIPLGGVVKDPWAISDPLDYDYCVHC